MTTSLPVSRRPVRRMSACAVMFLAITPLACAAAPLRPSPEVAVAEVSSPAIFAQEGVSASPPPPAPIERAAPPQTIPTLPPSPIAGPRSTQLPNGFYNPMPGGVLAGYRADTGLDIAGSPRRVFALAAGTLDYAELGHTLWTGPHDTANTIRIRLDAPIAYKGRTITHVWYAHLSALEVHQTEGAAERRHIEAGELLGISGIARGSPHLHVGMLLDDDVTQYWGTFLLEDEIREVLGGLRRGQRLPELHASDHRVAHR